MTEINTFSAAVDDVRRRAGRPDRLADAVGYVRQTIRECQVIALFARDLVELEVTTDASPFVWPVPSDFRQFLTVRLPLVDGRGDYIYVNEIGPGKAQRNQEYYLYRTLDSIVFAGVEANWTLAIAYYRLLKKLAYYEEAERPATFSLETEAWTYLVNGTDEENEAAREKVTNWLLSDWYDLIVEGGLAKMYKVTKDERSVSTFALYKSLQNDLLRGAVHVT